MEETAINKSEKWLKNVQKSSSSDSVDYSEITKYKGLIKNNKRIVEMIPNLSNPKEVSSRNDIFTTIVLFIINKGHLLICIQHC